MTAAATSDGITMTMSVSRMSAASSQPRKYPATPPITTPSRPATSPTITMICSEICVPRMTMAK